LDLPDYADLSYSFYSTWSLSPDGRYVAYVYRSPGSDIPAQAGTGFALYDTRTGQVRRHAVPSELGIAVDRWYWTSDDTVVISYGLAREAHKNGGLSTRSADTPLVWNVHVESAHDLVAPVRTFGVVGSGAGFVVMETLDGNVEVDPETGTILRDLGKHAPYGVLDPSATRTAATQAGNGDADGITPVVISTIPASPDGKVTRELVPGGVRVFDIYSWLDEDHLAVLELVGRATQELRVSRLDIRTGTARPLVDLSAGSVDVQLAGDLLTGPTVPGIEPPTPVDPRKLAAWTLTIVVAACWALIAWRRRVRP
jgi:hypothetical protein